MLKAFLISLGGQLYLLIQLVRHVASPGWRRIWITLPLFVLIWCASFLLNLIHWVGFLCDEILFHRYRNIEIKRPVFVLGVPRSGTTFLHRAMAKDRHLTSISTWQAIFAPSISERLLLGRLFGLFKTNKSSSDKPRHSFLARMDAIHHLDWNEPEEDFLLFWQLQACFLVFMLCPRSAHYWNLGAFDKTLPAWYRTSVMSFYQRCIQKHLYCEGEGKRYLSKNPSFTSLTGSLLEQFPDARIIACYRKPSAAIPSQLSSLQPALQLLGYRDFPVAIKAHLLETLAHYYSLIIHYVNAGQALPINQAALRDELQQTMSDVFNYLELPVDNAVSNSREKEDATNAHFRTTSHHYSLADYGLTDAEIERLFGNLWREIQLFNNLS